MYRFLLFTLFFVNTLIGGEEYSFRGNHFLASYLNCDRLALSNLEKLIETMDQAVAASRATVLDKVTYVFPPNGLALVYLLSEGHASLHTYPEYGHCFIDLFTCGDLCTSKKFHEVLIEYLKPNEVSEKTFLRDRTVEEIPFPR